MKDKVILAYSGGLDTSVCIRYLQKLHNLDVITVTVDCGQDDDFDLINRRALEIGAIEHIYIDAKKEFVTDYVIPCIKANGLYQGKYPLATALARPLIAKKIISVAEKLNAVAISHGCTGKGNDQVRFDLTIKSANPKLKILAPIRDMNLTRDVEIEFAKKENIPISEEFKKYSIDVNLWGRAVEGGKMEDPYLEPSSDAFSMIKDTINEDLYLELEFERGIPVSCNGIRMNMVDLITYLNEKVGSAGVGIIDHIEDRVIGIKSREVYEAPAAIAIIESHKDLEKMNLTKHMLRFKQLVEEQWAYLVYSGLWEEPLRIALDKFIEETQRRITGSVRLKLRNGSIRVVGRKSQFSLYQSEVASYMKETSFDQGLAKGFIDLWGMESVLFNNMDKS